MALWAEEVVEEWLSRQGYFTIRGVKLGVHEIDLLAVRHTGRGLECRHLEVQASMRPVSYLTRVPKAVQKATGRAAASAKARTDEELRQGIEERIRSRCRHPAHRCRLLPALPILPDRQRLIHVPCRVRTPTSAGRSRVRRRVPVPAPRAPCLRGTRDANADSIRPHHLPVQPRGPGLPSRAAAKNVPFKIFITELWQLDAGVDPGLGLIGDYYAKVTINGVEQSNGGACSDGSSTGILVPLQLFKNFDKASACGAKTPWMFTRDVPAGQPVTVRIQIFDSDAVFDDEADARPGSGNASREGTLLDIHLESRSQSQCPH